MEKARKEEERKSKAELAKSQKGSEQLTKWAHANKEKVAQLATLFEKARSSRHCLTLPPGARSRADESADALGEMLQDINAAISTNTCTGIRHLTDVRAFKTFAADAKRRGDSINQMLDMMTRF